MAQTPPPALTAFAGATPQRNDRATFSSRVDAFVTWFIASVAQYVALAANVYANALDTYANAQAAAVSAAAAAASSTTAASSFAFKGLWVNQVGAAAVPYSVYHLGKFWQLGSNIANVALKVPGTDAEWIAIPSGTSWVRKTANYAVAAGEGVLADTSAGPFTITLPAAPTAGQEVPYVDAAGTFAINNLTIARNGLKIMGLAEDMTVSENYGNGVLVYDNATNGWRIRS